MDAADAFTVIPRSLSTVNVSNSVISSLASFLLAVAVDVVVVEVDELSFVVSAEAEEEIVAFLLFILSSLSLPTWYAFNCRSCPKFPVY